jgi:hypothetical protein
MDIKVRFLKDFEDYKSGQELTLPATSYWPLKTSGVVIRLKEFSEQTEPEQPKVKKIKK